MKILAIGSASTVITAMFGPPQHDQHMIEYRWAMFKWKTYGLHWKDFEARRKEKIK